MKKISILILTVSCFIVYISCNPDPTPEEAAMQNVDAAAGHSYFDACCNPDGENADMCQTEATYYGMAASDAYASGNGANRSAEGLSKDEESEILLPYYYKIERNPFEGVGIAHNRILFYLIHSKNGKTTKDFLDGNEIALNKIADIIVESQKLDSKLVTQIKENLRLNMTTSFYDQNIIKYKKINSENLFANSKLPASTIEYFQNIFYGVFIAARDAKNNKTGAVMNFINKKITGILDSTEKINNDKKGKLVFLSILKHSYYYWNN